MANEINEESVIELTSTDDQGRTIRRVVSVGAMASWGVLLGLTDPTEILAAIMYVQDNGEPPPAANGETVWAESYRAIAAREVARSEEIKRATEEGTASDPRSPKLRGAIAAMGFNGAVADAQLSTREQLLPPEVSMPTTELPISAQDLKEVGNRFVESVRSAVDPG